MKDMVNYMGTDIVVNLVEDAVITINRRECAFEVIPVVATVPRNIIFGVVEISHQGLAT